MAIGFLFCASYEIKPLMSSNSVLIIVNCRQQKIRVRTRTETVGHTIKYDTLCDIRKAEYYVTLITLRNNLNGFLLHADSEKRPRKNPQTVNLKINTRSAEYVYHPALRCAVRLYYVKAVRRMPGRASSPRGRCQAARCVL